MKERRRYTRFLIEGMEVQCRMFFATEVNILNMSLGGVALSLNKRLNMGEKYTLKIDSEGKTISLEGVVDPLFERYANLLDPPVRVYVNRGRVTLVGLVGSRVEQATVGHLARGTLAFSVTNLVEVESEVREREERRKTPVES